MYQQCPKCRYKHKFDDTDPKNVCFNEMRQLGLTPLSDHKLVTVEDCETHYKNRIGAFPWQETPASIVKKHSINVLSVGCGAYSEAECLQQTLPDSKINFFGFDNDAAAIEAAKKQFPKDKFEELSMGDIAKLRQSFEMHFKAPKADIIILRHPLILHFVDDIKKLLAEFLAVGGVVLISNHVYEEFKLSLEMLNMLYPSSIPYILPISNAAPFGTEDTMNHFMASMQVILHYDRYMLALFNAPPATLAPQEKEFSIRQKVPGFAFF